MELRQAGKDEQQGDVQSAENANTDATFSKLRFSVVIEVEKIIQHSVVSVLCSK